MGVPQFKAWTPGMERLLDVVRRGNIEELGRPSQAVEGAPSVSRVNGEKKSKNAGSPSIHMIKYSDSADVNTSKFLKNPSRLTGTTEPGYETVTDLLPWRATSGLPRSPIAVSD